MLNARRHRPEGVLPLELWDVLIGGTPLYRVPDVEQPQAIVRAVQALTEGTARRLRAGVDLPRLQVARVVLGGGGALQQVQHAFRQVGIDAFVAEQPRYIAEPGGRALLRELGCDLFQGMVADIGQTAIKRSSREGRACIERPLARVPIEDEQADRATRARRRLAVVHWIAHALQLPEPPRALILALPCEVSADLEVAGCSYPWSAGDRTLVADVLRSAGLDQTPCLVVNDAELAALSVAQQRPCERATLVLTLGLGLGAAYLLA